MNRPLKVGLVGVKPDGVPKKHIESILALAGEEGLVEFDSAADTRLEDNPAADELRAKGVTLFSDYKKMLDTSPIDVVTIATPHHFHVPMAKYALDTGTNVFLEKPPAVTVQSGQELLDAQGESGKLVGVNYMHTASRSALELLARISSGELGDICSITGIGEWCRPNEYYSGRPWAGKKTVNGVPILDGALFNQFPHLLNQCIYFLHGFPHDKNLQPTFVRAELYRAHDPAVLEMEDIVCLNARLNDTNIFLYCTVCNDTEEPLHVRIIGTKGEALWYVDSSQNITGFMIQYKERPNAPKTVVVKESWGDMCKAAYSNFVAAVSGEETKYMTLENALAATTIINGAYLSSGGIRQIPSEFINIKEEEVRGTDTSGQARKGIQHKVLVEGMRGLPARAAAMHLMYGDFCDALWAQPCREGVDLTNLKYFDVSRI